jgi:hypothetical protein
VQTKLSSLTSSLDEYLQWGGVPLFATCPIFPARVNMISNFRVQCKICHSLCYKIDGVLEQSISFNFDYSYVLNIIKIGQVRNYGQRLKVIPWKIGPCLNLCLFWTIGSTKYLSNSSPYFTCFFQANINKLNIHCYLRHKINCALVLCVLTLTNNTCVTCYKSCFTRNFIRTQIQWYNFRYIWSMFWW